MLSRVLMLVFGFIAMAHGTSATNISQVLDTDERTWIYSPTWNKSKCVSYVKYAIECLHGFCYYYYNQSRDGCMKSRRVRIAEIQQTCLVTNYGHKPCVVTREKIPPYNEVNSKVLMHWDEQNGCGVYKVLPAPKPEKNILEYHEMGKGTPKATSGHAEHQKCELHVRDKAFRHGRNHTPYLNSCEDAWKEHCGGKPINLTNYNCTCP